MFDYLQQFNNLPADLRNKVSSPQAMAVILELENKYKIDLAMTVMKIMIKSVAVQDLPAYFISDFGLTRETAEALSRELKEKVLASAADYLGLAAELRAFDLDKDIDALIKDAGLMFASENLKLRFKNIIGTYLKGVRNKIDTRNSLAKDAKIGGLNLSSEEIDRVLKICDNGKFSVTSGPAPIIPKPQIAASSLDRLIAADVSAPAPEYNLKAAILNGQIKTPAPAPLDTKHEISGPDKQLDLPTAPVIAPVKPEIPKPIIPTPASITPAPKPIIPIPAAPSSPVMKSAQLPPLKAAVKPATPIKKVAAVRPAEKSSFWSRFGFNKKNKIKPVQPVKPIPSVKPVASVKPVVPINPVQPIKPVPPVKPVQPITQPIKPVAPTAQPIRSTVSPAALRPSPAASSARPQMHDVKPVPRVMGPIEELQFLDLINFRRLGKTPVEITSKILAKIKLLEKDGYDKMVAGVKAWRQSPVYHLYLRLGQEALVKGITLKEVIDLRQKSGQEYLSPEEIVAIVKLNSKLIF